MESVKVRGRSGGLVVSILALISDDPRSNPVKVYFFCKMCERNKINKKRPVLTHSLLKSQGEQQKVNFIISRSEWEARGFESRTK